MKQTKLNLLSALLFVAAMALGQTAWAQTFTIEASHDNSNNKTTFTITRSGTNLPAQIIKYRTVNLSAYAGQHYTAVSDYFTFAANATSTTVEVAERTPTKDAYKYQNSTQRSYRFEVLDVNGFQLAYYDRNMTTGAQFSNAKVSKEITDLVYFSNNSYASGLSSEKYLDVSFTPPSGYVEANDENSLEGYVLIDDSYNYATKPATVSTSELINSTNATASYLKSLGYKIYATVCFSEKERDDGYQYVQILTGTSSASYDGYDPNGQVNDPDKSVYKACFELADGSNSSGKAFFPHRYDCETRTSPDGCNQTYNHTEFQVSTGRLWKQKFKSGYQADNSGSLVFNADVVNITTRFDAAGDDNDTWGYKNFFVRMALCDATNPTLYGNNTDGITVSAGPYVKGNTFYISVPFSEIVHISGAYKQLNTSWGTVEYVEGDYTNVITYKGTINASAGTTLAITEVHNSLFNDLAGNYFQGNDNTCFDKTFTGITCSESYTLAATNTSFSTLSGDYWVSDNDHLPQPEPTVYFYKGIMNSSNRVTLTKNTNYTFSWSNNTAAGTGTVTATGAGNYNGSVSTTFPIRWGTYTVNFHDNGTIGIPATGTMSSQSFQYGVAQNLTANAFSREGFTFAGWNTQPDGSGTAYSNEEAVTGLNPEDGGTVDLYAQWAVIPWTGSGNSADAPYIILYASQLDSLASTVNSGTNYQYKYFKLGDNITYSTIGLGENESNYTAIGTTSKPFNGTFDGDGKTVSGIHIHATSDYQGLFGNAQSPTVKNIILANSIIVGKNNVGGIVGYKLYGTVTNCRVENDVIISGNDDRHGGIVGFLLSGTVSGCFSAASVNGTWCCGGIVGDNSSSILKDCLFSGSVTGNNGYGSIAGINSGTLANNYYTTDGLGGVNDSDCDGARRARTVTLGENVALNGDETTSYNISNLTAIGTSTLSYTPLPQGGAGGGPTIYSGATQTLVFSYTGTVNTGYDLAFTYNDGSTHAISYNSFEMPASDVTVNATVTDVWGIAAGATGSSSHPYIISSTTGLDLLAKMVNGTHGYTATGFSSIYFKLGDDITYSYEGLGENESNYTAIGHYDKQFLGNFDGDGKTISGIRLRTTDNYQGLFGNVAYGTIKNVILANSIIIGGSDVGGIAGEMQNSSVTNCFVKSDVTLIAGKDNSAAYGGIVGYLGSSTISGCISAAEVIDNGYDTCHSYGGIVGLVSWNSGSTVKDCLYIGSTVTASKYLGAIVGKDVSNNTLNLTNNYYTAIELGGLGGNGNATVSADCDGARRARVITLDEDIALTGDQTAYNHSGLTAIGTSALSYTPLPQGGAGGGPTIYSGATQDVTLSYTGEPTIGYEFTGFTATNNATINGNILTMPDDDVSVSTNFTDLWGIIANSADGSQEHPYMITSTAGLDLLAKNVNGTDHHVANGFSGMFFKLGNDITYTYEGLGEDESNYTAIGTKTNGLSRLFRGTFNGCGYTVSGIRIRKGNDDEQGLFGHVTGGTIKNVTLTDAVITGKGCVGGIAGYISQNMGTGGIIENCHVTNSVTINAVVNNANEHGGIVGQANGDISGCSSAVTLTVADGLTGWSFGGIAGYLCSDMQNCLVIGANIPDLIHGNDVVSAAIVGCYDTQVPHNLSHNYYIGVTIGGATTGIGVGDGDSINRYDITDNDGAVPVFTITLGTDISATATVAVNYNNTNYYTSGTEVTLSYSGTVPDGYFLGFQYNDGSAHDVTGNSFEMPAADVTVNTIFTPDIATYWHADANHDGTTEERAYIITTTTGLDMLAREVNVGNNFNNTFFKLGANITYSTEGLGTNESNFTPIAGAENAMFSGTFDGCNDTISGIRIYNGDKDTRGLFGDVSGGTIKNVTLTDAVITGHYYVGGFVGSLSKNGGQGGIIENCHVTSSVTIHAVVEHAHYHGGIVGWFHSGTVSGCTSSATLNMANGLTHCIDYGGIVGNMLGGNLQNCLVLGASITGTNCVGAIVGYKWNGPSCTANYYHGCTINGTANATNVGVGGVQGASTPQDIDGAVPAYVLTFGDNINITQVAAASFNNTLYYTAGTEVTLTYTGGPVPEGQVLVVRYNDGSDHDLTPTAGVYSFEMPTTDVSVTATLYYIFNLTYDLAGGSFDTPYPDTYTYDTPTFTLVNPTRTGYNFTGWTGTDLTEVTLSVTIPQGSIGDRSFLAHWETIPWSGTGIEEDPYMIIYPSQLDLLATRVNDGFSYGLSSVPPGDNDHPNGYFFRLGADLAYDPTDLDDNGENYTAVGFNNTYGGPSSPFSGTFDGCGHTVSGIRINKRGDDGDAVGGQGLFGYIKCGTVRNVTITDADITGKDQVGGIVGWAESGTLQNCHVTGSVALHAVQNNANNFGGVVGWNASSNWDGPGIVEGCTSGATMTVANDLIGCQKFGGIAGNNTGIMRNCLVLGATIPALHYQDVYNDFDASGAIVGSFGEPYSSNYDCSLSHNYYHGVTIGGATTGIGVGSSTIVNNFNTTTVNVRHDVTTDNGAVVAYTLSLPDGIYATSAAVLTCNNIHCLASGTTVTLSLQEGYTTSGYTVKDAQNNNIDLTDGNTFVMPASDVTVTASLSATPWSGTGTKDDPYMIIYRSQLDLLAQRVNSGTGDDDASTGYSGKYFKLGNNISYNYEGLGANESNYTAIGNGNNAFHGTFDGAGHTVSGIRIYNMDNQGLFGIVMDGAIKNLTLTDAVITGNNQVGGIVGYIIGSMDNCLAIGANVSGNQYVGAIMGRNDNSTLNHNYYNNCMVNGTANAMNVGCGSYGDIEYNYGAMPCFRLTLPMALEAGGSGLFGSHGQRYVVAGQTVTLAPTYQDYILGSVTVTKDGSQPAETVEVTNNSFVMPAAAVTVTVTWGGLPIWDGTGYKKDPYIITNCAQLDALAIRINSGDNCRDSYFKLGNDISYSHTSAWDDANSKENNFTAIGTRDNPFLGHLDGDGHTISGIRVYKPDEVRQGFIGALGDANYYGGSPSITNLTLSDARITGKDNVGGIVGYSYQGTIDNCHVTSTVAIHAEADNSFNHGGIVGDNFESNTLRLCTSSATLTVAEGVRGCRKFGGLAGSHKSLNSFYVCDNNLAVGVTISGAAEESGAIVGNVKMLTSQRSSYGIQNNYYYNCRWGNSTSNIGTGNYGDVDFNDGAVPAIAVTRTIQGYGDSTESDHWAFIASPMSRAQTPYHVMGLIATPASHYDLYEFAQDSVGAEWQNFKAHPGIILDSGKGLLYASKETVTLTFLGRLLDPQYGNLVNTPLPYTEGAPLAGYHLVGNPFTEPATIDRSYYMMNEAGTGIVAEAVGSSTPIAPCTGVIVQTTAAEVESYENFVTFTKGAKRGETTGNGSLNIALHQAQGPMIDNAVVSFDEGAELGKFYFGKQDANIYIPQDGKEYAIVCSDGIGEIPVNFKAKKNGEYTLTVSTSLNSKFQILNLIDNLTGASIDLLQTPSYTFTTRSDDYPSRFKLVFDTNDNENDNQNENQNEDFAFISNGNLIVSGTGTLQVFDMMGRTLFTSKVNSSLLTPHSSLLTPHFSLSPGVYVLQLINGEKVKTQKIIIN